MRKKLSRVEGRGSRAKARQKIAGVRRPFLVGIAGGSGAGKTFLAGRLQAALGRSAARVSLDDFYRDRSGVPAARRDRINFDHPRAIDWPAAERAVRRSADGRGMQVPKYNFKTHCRSPRNRCVPPKPVILMDGLWILLRPSLRRLFDLTIFIRCRAQTRLQRRLHRDLRTRGRTAAGVRQQFLETVQPMHEAFVSPQEQWADVVLDGNFDRRAIDRIAARLKTALKNRNL